RRGERNQRHAARRCAILRVGVAIGAGRPPALRLSGWISPPSRERLVGDATRPATSGPHHATMGTESTDGPHWGGGDRPSPCFGAPPALGRGLRHPAACAFAVHHPCCRHLGPTPKGGRVKS